VLVVRRRYDVRAAFLVVSMALRLAALALGAPRGVTAAVTAIVIAQVIATAAIGAVGWIAVRRYPEGAREPLAEDRADFRSFVVKSSIGSVLSPMRGILGTLLVGIVTGPLQVAYFRVAQAPQNAFAALSSPARLILLSEQTHQVESGRTDLLYRMLRRYVIGTTAAMVVLVPPLLWLTPSFIRFAYKDKHGVPYLGAVDAMRLMLIVGAIQVVWGWTKSYPVSIGRPELRIVAQSIEIAVLIPLLIVLASLYGATGAASAFLVASVVFALVWTVIVLRLRREPGGEDPATPELVAPEPLLP
jgi:O-antigen/teichoic acid export membrane protein